MIPTSALKIGRPHKTPVDSLRARLWYYAVKARTTLNDYQLDLMFLGKLGKLPTYPQGRLRLFENVRLYGTLPSTGNHPKRDFDLIQLVDEQEEFAGTAGVFHSPYWQLLTLHNNEIEFYKKIAEGALSRLGLVRLDFKGKFGMDYMFDRAYEQTAPGLPIQNDYLQDRYNLSLQYVIKASPPTLDRLVLLGALFREAYLAGILEIAIQIKGLYCEILEDYIRQDWLKPVAHTLQDLGEDYLLSPYAYEYYIRVSNQLPDDEWSLDRIAFPIWFANEAEPLQKVGEKVWEYYLKSRSDFSSNS